MKIFVWIIGIGLLAAIGAGIFHARNVSGQMEAATKAAADAEDAAKNVADTASKTAAKAVADAAAQAKAATNAATPQLWDRGEYSSQFPHPMRYQRRNLPGYEGEYEIVPQAWVEGESNCRVTNGSVRVCSGMWQGYADLVISPVPKCGAAVKKGATSTACVAPATPATPVAPATPATPAAAPATRAIPDIPAILPSGGIVAPPAPATAGPAAMVGGGV